MVKGAKSQHKQLICYELEEEEAEEEEKEEEEELFHEL